MRVLNLMEFEDYCAGIKHPCYVFSTINQNNIPHRMSMSMRFDRISIVLKPNRISLINNGGRMTMENVKKVHVFDDVESIGTRIDVICAENKKDIVYTFLID